MRLWNGRTGSALDLINQFFRLAKFAELGTVACHLFRQGLMNLRTYIKQDCTSNANYGERHRAGRRIASKSFEANLNGLVTRRMVKKQQTRWSEKGANLLL